MDAALSQSHEFLNQGWGRKDASTRSPNVLAVSQRFNRTVQWVTMSILEKRAVKSRARRMSKLIEIASVRAASALLEPLCVPA